MAEATRKQTLHPLLEACCGAICEELGSRVGRKIDVEPTGLSATTPAEVAARQKSPVAIVRGKLDKHFEGKTLRFLCDVAEAATLAGAVLMQPEDILAKHRQAGVLEGKELEAFAEVAQVVCASIDAVLRKQLGSTGLQRQDHATLAPAATDTSMLGDDELYELALTIQVASYPPTQASILIDRDTGDRWNGGPVAFGPFSEDAEPTEADDGPAAPVRGRLAAFVVDGHTTPMLRKVCRRVGLELDKRPRGEVPNPAANHDAVIFIEIPPSDDRRFDWCRRIKTFRPQTKVAVLLVLPSRHQVLQAARAGADVVLGHPISREHLAQKLTALLEPEATPEDPGVPVA